MKIINWILALLWLVFAAVQYNDPDPILWILMYSLVALVCAMAAMNKYSKPLIIIGIAASLVWAATLFPAVIDYFSNHESNEILEHMSPDKLFIEEARECFGLILSALVLLWKFFESKKA